MARSTNARLGPWSRRPCRFSRPDPHEDPDNHADPCHCKLDGDAIYVVAPCAVVGDHVTRHRIKQLIHQLKDKEPRSTTLATKHIKHGALIELRDDETSTWIPLTIVSIVFDNVECRTLANEPILTTTSALVKNARLRPSDGSCLDCSGEAHAGPCVDRICADCTAPLRSRCVHHPEAAVHVYHRKRYLAEIIEDKPYPTRERAEGIRRDLLEQVHVLRNAEQPRQSRVMITAVERGEIISALENAIRLIEALPSEKRRDS
jgi:hypothetical protein